MIDELTKNIDSEIEMLREISGYIQRLETANSVEKSLLVEVINSLTNRMRIVNASVPEILKNISLNKKIDETKSVKTTLEKLSMSISGQSKSLVLNKKDKDNFLKELVISEKYVNNLKKISKENNDKDVSFQKSRGYVKFANQIFFKKAREMTKKGSFSDLNKSLRRANIEMLLESYVSVMFFTTLLSGIFGMLLGISFIMMASFALSTRILLGIALIVLLPAITYLALYYYPATEKDSLGKKIDQELPFAVIHMSAISGAGIEPTNIFKIIGLSREYPNLRMEIRKVLNQINIYGYDLVTALNNVARNTPSQKLNELFIGLSTNISSGGSLQTFFEKRAETLLVGYRLEREKFTKMAETFMDIYITVVIAAPMILLLIFILLSVGDFNVGISPQAGTVLLIMLVAFVNLIFLGIIHLKQPAY